ncbi:MAG: hypothetical protein IJ005_01615 [Bacteroidales bacterium]|nr:hypothetical protein [Bacteroidales bacterium]
MKKYIDEISGERIVEVEDLSFLKDRNHHYGWFRRHFHHFRMHCAIRWADRFIAADDTVATDLVRYYFVPKEKISIRNH